MPAAVAVPAVMAAVGTGASLYGAGQQRSAMGQATAAQRALADRMFYMGMPAYGKKAKQGMFAMLEPMMQNYLSGNLPQIISPELEAAEWEKVRRPMEEAYTKGRGQTEQGMVNRGLEYGNILPTTMGDYDQKYQGAVADARTDIATRAAQLNYGAQQDFINRLLNTYSQLFRQGEAVRMGREGQSVTLQSDANAAGAAGAGNYWNSLAGAMGGLSGLPWGQMFAGGGYTNQGQPGVVTPMGGGTYGASIYPPQYNPGTAYTGIGPIYQPGR